MYKHTGLPNVFRICYDCVTRIRHGGVEVNGMTPTTMWTRVARGLGLDHNPLRRRIDVIEAWLVPAVIAVFLLLGPLVAGVVGLQVHAGNATLQQAQRAWRPASAVLLQAAPGPMMPDNGNNSWLDWTRARWTYDGRTRVGEVPVRSDTRAGTTVRVWLDRAGNVQPPPLTAAAARQRITVAVAFTLACLALLLVGLALLARKVLNRRRLRDWEADWLLVGPQWSHHG
jgi:hypothetical protein